jgi:hypothetical protein
VSVADHHEPQSALSDNPAAAVFQREWQIYRKMVDHNYLFHREAYERLRQIASGSPTDHLHPPAGGIPRGADSWAGLQSNRSAISLIAVMSPLSALSISFLAQRRNALAREPRAVSNLIEITIETNSDML